MLFEELKRKSWKSLGGTPEGLLEQAKDLFEVSEEAEDEGGKTRLRRAAKALYEASVKLKKLKRQ